METYSENPTVRGLVELAKAIPGAGSFVSIFDASVLASLERYREKQFAAFFDEMSQSGLDPDVPIPDGKQYDVVRAILITTEAVAKSHREEKIRAFARLLVSGVKESPRISISDEFEDYVSILDEVSWREMQMLALLAEFENPYRRGGVSPTDRDVHSYWSDFIEAASQIQRIPLDELLGLLSRLSRTGLYEIRIVTLVGKTQVMGALTGSYFRLADLIR